MDNMVNHSGKLAQPGDVARWFTFTAFWGFVYYLLSFAGILGGHRYQPVRADADAALVGMGIHVGIFVAVGSLFSAINSVARKQSTTAITQQRVAAGTFENSILLQAISGGVGAILPFMLAVGSMRAAEQITGKAVFPDGRDLNWPRACGISMILSGLTALGVSRIAAWIVSDTRAVYASQRSV